MKLDEVLEIIFPEQADPNMIVDASEADFIHKVWQYIQDSENQVHLYYLLMNSLINWAKDYPKTPFLHHPEDLKLLDETTYETDIDLGGGSKLPIRIGIAVNVDLLDKHLLDKMHILLAKMLDRSLTNSEEESTHEEALNYLTAQEMVLRDELLRNLGVKGFNKEALINSFVESLKLEDISEDLELVREFRFKILGQISNQLSENNSGLKELEQDGRAGIKRKFLDRLNEYNMFTHILEMIGLDMSKRSKPIMSPAILHFYSRSDNFNDYILNSEEANEGHRILLQVVLDFLLANKKIGLDLFDHLIASFRSRDQRLNSYDNLSIDFPDFQIHPFHYNKLINSLIQETESVLGLLQFKWNDAWHESSSGLEAFLPVVKLQRLEIINYDTDRIGNAAFKNHQALIKGFPPLESYILNNDETTRYLGSFDGCEHFFVSQTGLDLQVFNPKFTHKFDFFNRTVFKKNSNGEFVSIEYTNASKRLTLMRKAIQDVFPTPKNKFANNFKFSNNWKGLYHVRLGRKRSGGVRNLYLETNIVAYRTGGGYGVGRADNVIPSEYLWTCNGDDEQQIKVAKWLKLDSTRFIQEDYQYPSIGTPGKFQHEFVSDADGVKYVRVNLPYINEVRVKRNVAEEGVAILNTLGIKYYRKVNEQLNVVKKDTKNYPHSGINLPVCFDIPDNYRFLHKFRDEYGSRAGSKWLMRIQREKSQLESPTGSKSDLNALKGGDSATDYAREKFIEQKHNEVDIWENIKSPFESLPTLQEWCHLHGRGDGGPDESNNLVAGSNHCNTEQAAIELAQRLTTQNSATEYLLRTTAYLFQETQGTGAVINTVSSVISQVQPTSSKQGKKRSREEDDDGENPRRKKRKIEIQNAETSLAAFIRYRVYRKNEKSDVKLLDYTFEGQSEFFDMNQYRIVNSIVEYILKGNETPWND